MAKPLAVLISDLHYTLGTLDLADSALRSAIKAAEDLNIPLIIAGDTLDSKSIIRAECANRLITTLKSSKVKTFTIVGNHDRINEKSSEHSLNFLEEYTTTVNSTFNIDNVWLLAYQHDKKYITDALKVIPHNSIIIMHQGVQSAYMGHYIQDKTSLPLESFKNHRVISGHYHRAQDLGTVSYIGNPYTLSFGEANDGPKGYAVLYSDGSIERIPLDLRKHVVIDISIGELSNLTNNTRPIDLVLLKIKGNRHDLQNLKLSEIRKKFIQPIKIDLIPTDQNIGHMTSNVVQTDAEILDKVIDTTSADPNEVALLKKHWRLLLEV